MLQVPVKVVTLIGMLSFAVGSGVMLKGPQSTQTQAFAVPVAQADKFTDVPVELPVKQVVPQVPGPVLPCCPNVVVPPLLKVSIKYSPAWLTLYPNLKDVQFPVVYKGNVNLVHIWEGFETPLKKYWITATSSALSTGPTVPPNFQGVNPPVSGMQIYFHQGEIAQTPTGPVIVFRGPILIDPLVPMQLRSCSPLVTLSTKEHVTYTITE